MTASDTQYMAGIFDATGRVHYSPRYQTLTIDVCARHRDLLIPFTQRFGSMIARGGHRIRPGGSRIMSNNAQTFVWRIENGAALAFLREMLPFLRVRADVAAVALLLDTMPVCLADFGQRRRLKEHLVRLQEEE